MAVYAKTIVATGATSGLGFEAVKQILQQSQTSYKFIIGARNVQTTEASFDALKYDAKSHNVDVLKLDLSDLRSVKDFAQQTLQKLSRDRLDILILNAGINKAATTPAWKSSPWCEAYLVNHLSQHYLMQCFHEKLVQSYSHIVFVSSGLIRSVNKDDIESFKDVLGAESRADAFAIYKASKFIQLLGASWWRNQLRDQASVLAVSPGLVIGTGLGRYLDSKPNLDNLPDKLTVEEGAKNLLRAIWTTELPEDEEQIFLTSTGEWWPTTVYPLILDRQLQNQWCTSKKAIEKEGGLD